MELRQVRLTDPLVAPLIGGLTRVYDERYGETGEMATVDAEEFDPPAGTFLVLIDGGEVHRALHRPRLPPDPLLRPLRRRAGLPDRARLVARPV
jgi:hypothetical protein